MMKFSSIFVVYFIAISSMLLVSCDSIEISKSQQQAEAELELQWIDFKQTYGKQYDSIEEEQQRKQIFLENLRKISSHNQMFENGQKTFELGLNKFADWTLMEFQQYTASLLDLSWLLEASSASSDADQIIVNADDLPEELDWTQKGLVAPIQDQGKCGSCWAFSTIAAIEGQLAKKTGKLVKLSEQQLVDCSYKEGNMGCGGGLPEQAYQYIIDNDGIDTEESYPYIAHDQPCQQDNGTKTIGTKLSGYNKLPFGNELALQQAVANIGPISVLIDANHHEFMLYKSGVYDNPLCETVWFDHAVNVVGYGRQDHQDYWKVKNSYGTDWGMDGYILMSRNKGNQCGIASKATYPIL